MIFVVIFVVVVEHETQRKFAILRHPPVKLEVAAGFQTPLVSLCLSFLACFHDFSLTLANSGSLTGLSSTKVPREAG